MKAIDISTKSWHYRIAYWGAVSQGSLASWVFQELDFCAYVRAVIGGMFKAMWAAIGISIVVGGILYITGFTAYQLYRLVFLGTVDPGTCVGAAFAIIALACTLAVLISKRRKEERLAAEMSGYEPALKEPGFIAQAYSSWKHKYCARINFVSPHSEE